MEKERCWNRAINGFLLIQEQNLNMLCIHTAHTHTYTHTDRHRQKSGGQLCSHKTRFGFLEAFLVISSDSSHHHRKWPPERADAVRVGTPRNLPASRLLGGRSGAALCAYPGSRVGRCGCHAWCFVWFTVFPSCPSSLSASPLYRLGCLNSPDVMA